MDEKSLSHSPWDYKYHIVFGGELPEERNLWKDKSGYRENPQGIV